ncbi:hypothetical protein PGB90_006809 [Kerria lacca]
MKFRLTVVKEAYDRILCNENTSCPFDEFVNFDNEVAVAKTLTDADIVSSVTRIADDDNVHDEEDEHEERVVVTTKEVKESMKVIRQYLQRINIGDDVFDAPVHIENLIDMAALVSLSQKINKEFFLIYDNFQSYIICTIKNSSL